MKTGLTRPTMRLRFLDGENGGSGDAGAAGNAGTEADTKQDAEQLGEAGIEALRKERARAEQAEKSLAALKKQWDDTKKTSEQKAADDLKAAQDEATQARTAAGDAELRALRLEVAADKGLDLALAPRLSGSTKQELEKDAETLKTLVGSAKQPPSKGPKPDRSQGGGSGTATDPREAGKAEAAKRFGSTKTTGKD